MPPLPDVPLVVRVATIATYGEDADVVNRFYMLLNGPTSTPADLNTACTSVALSWNTNLAPKYHTSYTLTEVIMEDLTTSGAPVGAAATSHAGTLNGPRLSAATCALIRFHIGRRYRGGHPRAYLAAGDANQLTDNQAWTPAFLTGLVSAWSAFINGVDAALQTAYAASPGHHVNVSYYQSFENITYPSGRIYPRPKLRVTPLVDLVTSYTANPKVASQRRRNLTP